MKVLHVIKGIGRGGAERLLVSNIRRHAAKFSFEVVYFLPHKDHLRADLERLGCRVTVLPATGFLGMLLRLPQLIRLLRDHRIDLMHAHLPMSGILAALASRLTGIPVVYSEHNLFSRYHPLTRWLSAITCRQRAMTIAVSQAVAGQLPKGIPSCVIENGVDVDEFDPKRYDGGQIRQQLGLPSRKTIVGCVAIFTRQKRLERWLEICRRAHRSDPDLYFVLIGDGPLRPELEAAGKDLFDAGVLRFPGRVENPEQWLACMDVFLMSSDYEGLPVALLEAMSLELPVVVTRVGGNASVIVQDQNGFFYEPERLEEAVERVMSLVRDPGLRHRIGQHARQTICDGFSVSKSAARIEEVYDHVFTKVFSS